MGKWACMEDNYYYNDDPTQIMMGPWFHATLDQVSSRDIDATSKYQAIWTWDAQGSRLDLLFQSVCLRPWR